jgi:hypothetical protein
MSIVRDALKVLDQNLGMRFCIPCWATAAGLRADRDQAALHALAKLYKDIVSGQDTCSVCSARTAVVTGRGQPARR